MKKRDGQSFEKQDNPKIYILGKWYWKEKPAIHPGFYQAWFAQYASRKGRTPLMISTRGGPPKGFLTRSLGSKIITMEGSQ